MWGFLYRSTVGGRPARWGGKSHSHLLANVVAVLSLPLVWLGVARDFWEPFDVYRDVENDLPPTYFFIPFAGARVTR